MTRGKWGTIAITGVIMIVILSVITALVMTDDEEKATATTPANISVMVAGKGCDNRAVVTQALYNRGFVEGEFVVGVENIDFDAPEANERGSTAFASETPKTAKAVTSELKSDNPKAPAALKALQDQSGASRELVLDPKNWEVGQTLVPSTLDENTQFKQGEAVSAGVRQSDSGDVVWYFVHPDKCVQVENGQAPPEDAVTAHRAGCGNPQGALPRPTTPTTPGDNPRCPYNPNLPPDSPDCVKTDDGQLGGGREQNQGQGCPYQEYPGGPCLEARPADAWVDPGDQDDSGFGSGTVDRPAPVTTSTTLPPAVANPEPGTGSGGNHSGDPCMATPKPDYCP